MVSGRIPEWPKATSFLGSLRGIWAFRGGSFYPSNTLDKTLDSLLGLKGIRLLGTLRRSHRQSGDFLFQFFLLSFFRRLFLLL